MPAQDQNPNQSNSSHDMDREQQITEVQPINKPFTSRLQTLTKSKYLKWTLNFLGTLISGIIIGIIVHHYVTRSQTYQDESTHFANLALRYHSNALDYYFKGDPLSLQLTTHNQSKYNWNRFTIISYSVSFANSKVDLNDIRVFTKRTENIISLLPIGHTEEILIELEPKVFTMESSAYGIRQQKVTENLIVNPFEYKTAFKHNIPIIIKEFSADEEKRRFHKMLKILTESSVMFDTLRMFLFNEPTISGGSIEFVYIDAISQTRKEKRFAKIFCIPHVWYVPKGTLMKMEDLFFFNSIISFEWDFVVENETIQKVTAVNNIEHKIQDLTSIRNYLEGLGYGVFATNYFMTIKKQRLDGFHIRVASERMEYRGYEIDRKLPEQISINFHLPKSNLEEVYDLKIEMIGHQRTTNPGDVTQRRGKLRTGAAGN